ncbi:unnamed protein product [Camellia sinensis]
MGRSPCCEKEHTNKGAWPKEEDELIIHLHGLISRTRFPRRSFLGRGVPAESPDDHRRALSYGFLLGVEGGSSSRNRFSALLTPRLLSSAAALLALATSLPTDSIATVFFDLPPSTAFPTAASLLSPLRHTSVPLRLAQAPIALRLLRFLGCQARHPARPQSLEKCWQPQDFLPDPASEGFDEQVRELRERAKEIPDDYFVILVETECYFGGDREHLG